MNFIKLHNSFQQSCPANFNRLDLLNQNTDFDGLIHFFEDTNQSTTFYQYFLRFEFHIEKQLNVREEL